MSSGILPIFDEEGPVAKVKYDFKMLRFQAYQILNSYSREVKSWAGLI